MRGLAVAEAGRGWEDAGSGAGRAQRTPEAAPAQPRLFAVAGGMAIAPVAAPEAAPAAARVTAPVASSPVRTLDDVLVGASTAVAAGRTAECPVCAGPVRPRWSAGAGAVGGRCADCGTSID